MENNNLTGHPTGYKDVNGCEICFGNLVGHSDCDNGTWEQIVVSKDGIAMGYGDRALKDIPASEVEILDPNYREGD